MRRDHTRIRVKKLRGKRLPQDYKDTNSVQAWMDKEQYILTVSCLTLAEDVADSCRNSSGWKIWKINRNDSSLIGTRMSRWTVRNVDYGDNDVVRCQRKVVEAECHLSFV
jgi:hypothetical protein